MNDRPGRLMYCALLQAVLVSAASCVGPSGTNDPGAQSSDQGADNDVRVIAEILTDLSGVEEQILALADAFAQAEYDWRPGDGVRSGAEVFMHVTAVNFAFPVLAGHAAPPSMGLTEETLFTAMPAFENSLQVKDEILPELRSSLDHVRAAIEQTTDLDAPVTVMGEVATTRQLWIGHVGHLHEHLGQLIAYARVNGIVPPWNR